MLGNQDAMATVSVKDFATARRFYEDKLNLEPVQTMEKEGMGIYKAGGGTLLVYTSQFAGTNQATAVTWGVGENFDAIVESLQSKGVTFERYDNLPDVTRDGDVHTSHGAKLAWFKDPDGNIHHLNSM